MKNNTRRLLQLLRDNARMQDKAKNTQDPQADEADAEEPEVAVEVHADGPHLYLFGVIDSWWGVSAESVIDALAPYRGQDVHMHINSPGGDVFEGRAIASAIVDHSGRVMCHIDGLCASAATYPAMAASTVDIRQGGMFMIHEGWTMGWGNKRELAQIVALLGKIDSDIIADYAKHSGATVDQVTSWVEAETWFTATEAQAAGFVDAVLPNTKREALADNRMAARSMNAARWNLSAYVNAPKLLPPEPEPAAPYALAAQVTAQLQTNRNRLRLLTA